MIGIVIGIALLEYFATAFLCGKARVRYGIAAPATTGDPTFERYFRVQQNTMEQLILFLPAILLFGAELAWREVCQQLPYLAVRRRAALVWPPTQMGMLGCWTGLGSNLIPSML